MRRAKDLARPMDGPSNASFERWLEMDRLNGSVHLVERGPLSDSLDG